jgi:hypothetical protein
LKDFASMSSCCILNSSILSNRRSSWQRGLRRGSAAPHFLGLGFQSRRVSGCLSLVSVVCCLVTSLWDGPLPPPEESYRIWCVLSVRDFSKPQINLSKPTGYIMHQQVKHSTTVRSAHTVFICFLFI